MRFTPSLHPVVDLRDKATLNRPPNSASTSGPMVTVGQLRVARLAALGAMVGLNVIDLITNRVFFAEQLSNPDRQALTLVGGGATPWLKGAMLVSLGWAVLKSTPRLSTTCMMWCVVGIYALASWMNVAILLAS